MLVSPHSCVVSWILFSLNRDSFFQVPEKYLLTDSQGRQLVFPELEDAALVRELHV